jgi:hypothetical protein
MKAYRRTRRAMEDIAADTLGYFRKHVANPGAAEADPELPELKKYFSAIGVDPFAANAFEEFVKRLEFDLAMAEELQRLREDAERQRRERERADNTKREGQHWWERAKEQARRFDESYGKGRRSGADGPGQDRTRGQQNNEESRERARHGQSNSGKRESDGGFRPKAHIDIKEAYEILGLKHGETLTEAEVRDAHRRLIKRVHPDAGGTDELAKKVNLALDAVLGHNGWG